MQPKTKLDHDTVIDTSNLEVKKDFITLKAKVDKLDINKLINVRPSLTNLETKVDDLDVVKLKTVPVDLKKSNELVDNGVVKNAKFKTIKTKVLNLEKNPPRCNYFNSHKSMQHR